MRLIVILSRKALKRLVDILGALVGLIILSPVMLVVAVVVYVSMGPPVLFRQERAGLNGRPFTLYKFRTMLDLRDKHGNLLPDEKRLTPVGRFLRNWSLDELPQFWNVLKGDMSLVGPRALLMEYLPFYTEREKLRHSVKPGITGWAQINGRNLLSWNERLEMDVWYVENWSILLDIKILFLTVIAVLNKKGLIVNPRSVMLDLDEERSQINV